ncbi:Plasmodium vivax Vir protein, putative [Plasmodium vivax]|nr:Plasmodium vivax Vir protein, putative [Plasmodium vivax]
MFNYRGVNIDDDVDILNTKYYYDKLDKGWDICQNDAFYNKAKAEINRNDGLENDSDKILRALCYIYKNRLSDTLDSDKCNFLYFWLGTILMEKLIRKDFFHEIILKLFNILLDNNDHQICQLPHSFMLKKDFNDIKTIFDCSEDYKSYITHLINPDNSCSNKYKSYLDTNINIYNRYYNECEVKQKGYVYCEAFSKYFPHNKPNLLSKFNCSLELKEPVSEKLGGGDDTELVQSEGKESNRGSPEKGKLSVGDRSRIESLALSPGSSAIQSETGDFQSFGSSDHLDGTPSTVTSKSITGAVTVAGALVPSYLLYNYTPAGNLINKLLGRTTRVNNNPLMEAQLINNFYQPEGFNSERSGYNISYRPV